MIALLSPARRSRAVPARGAQLDGRRVQPVLPCSCLHGTLYDGDGVWVVVHGAHKEDGPATGSVLEAHDAGRRDEAARHKHKYAEHGMLHCAAIGAWSAVMGPSWGGTSSGRHTSFLGRTRGFFPRIWPDVQPIFQLSSEIAAYRPLHKGVDRPPSFTKRAFLRILRSRYREPLSQCRRARLHAARHTAADWVAPGGHSEAHKQALHILAMGRMHLAPPRHHWSVFSVIKKLKEYARECKHKELDRVHARFLLGEFHVDVSPPRVTSKPHVEVSPPSQQSPFALLHTRRTPRHSRPDFFPRS